MTDTRRHHHEHDHDETATAALRALPAAEDIFDLADFFKIFGDSTRLKILFLLRHGEMCVIDIAKALGITQSAISHQLRTLKQMKLVSTRRAGKMIFYALADSHIESILGQGLEHIRE